MCFLASYSACTQPFRLIALLSFTDSGFLLKKLDFRDVKEIPLGFTTSYGCSDDYYNSGKNYLANIGDWIVGCDFLINTEDRVFKKANCTPWTYTSTPLFQYGPYLFSFGGYYANATRQNLFLATPYLATINNLETSVIKTADKTMKITYTIQEE